MKGTIVANKGLSSKELDKVHLELHLPFGFTGWQILAMSEAILGSFPPTDTSFPKTVREVWLEASDSNDGEGNFEFNSDIPFPLFKELVSFFFAQVTKTNVFNLAKLIDRMIEDHEVGSNFCNKKADKIISEFIAEKFTPYAKAWFDTRAEKEKKKELKQDQKEVKYLVLKLKNLGYKVIAPPMRKEKHHDVQSSNPISL